MTQQDIHDFMTAQGFRLAREFNSPHYVKDLDPYGDGKTDYLNHVSVEQAAQFYRLTLEARRDGMKQARSRVLRRTEIPRDAKNPTRDHIVVLGEQIADIISGDIAELDNQLS